MSIQILSHPAKSLKKYNIVPGSLKPTLGPFSHDHQCPICQDEIAETIIPTLEHKGCRRRFHPFCLRQWFANGGISCPICRARVRIADLRQLPGHFRRMFVRKARMHRQDPTEYHVISRMEDVVDMIQDVAEDVSYLDITWQVRTEITLVDEVLDAAEHERRPNGQPSAATPSYDTGEIRDLQHQFGLSDASLRNLWTGSRLFGVNDWYLLQASAVPDIGFWIPVLPRIKIPQEPKISPPEPELQQTRTIQVPLSADFICNYLGLSRGFIRPRTRRLICRLRELAATPEGAGSFGLFQHISRSLATSGLVAMPWPSASAENFEPGNLLHSGAEAGEVSTNGWNADLDKQFLEEFVRCQQHAGGEDLWLSGLSIGRTTHSDEGSTADDDTMQENHVGHTSRVIGTDGSSAEAAAEDDEDVLVFRGRS